MRIKIWRGGGRTETGKYKIIDKEYKIIGGVYVSYQESPHHHPNSKYHQTQMLSGACSQAPGHWDGSQGRPTRKRPEVSWEPDGRDSSEGSLSLMVTRKLNSKQILRGGHIRRRD